MEIVKQSLKDQYVREAKEEITSLGGKVNWATIKISSNSKNLITHEIKPLMLATLVLCTMF